MTFTTKLEIGTSPDGTGVILGPETYDYTHYFPGLKLTPKVIGVPQTDI